MKNSILTIFKKELARFFGDKRLVFTTILMPGLMIYLMYSLMGSALSSQYSVDDEYQFSVYAVALPDSVRAMAPDTRFEIQEIPADSVSEVKQALTDRTYADLLAVFPDGFDAQVAAYTTALGTPAPEVALYYNSTDANSQGAYDTFCSLLNEYETSLTNKFDINREGGAFDLASDRDLTGSVFSALLPMLLMMLLFSGCMAVAPESIAGEKERGTIATLLVTPVKRGHIALGKIFALSIIALLSGASSAIGVILSLPKLMGGAGNLYANVYTVTDYLWLGLVILSTVLLMVSLISIVSAYAKTVKEAQTFVMPLTIVVMLIGISAMFGSQKTELVYYLLPMYNSVQSMLGIFSFSIEPVLLLTTAAVNLTLALVCAFLLTRMFHSEKVVFSH